MELWAQLSQLICYQSGGPPDLPPAIMVHFDNYAGPTYTYLGLLVLISSRYKLHNHVFTV